jgi:uncharacterized membrane protein YfcA
MEIVALVALGLVAGALGNLLGLGGGFLVVPALLLGKGLDPRIATGTAIAVIVPTAAVALWGRAAQGHVEWRTAALIAVGSVVGAAVGSWLAGRVDPVWIRRIFAVVMAAVAIRLFVGGR